MLGGPDGARAEGAGSPRPPAPHEGFDEGKALFQLQLEERARFERMCGERPEHYPPADPHPAYDVTRYEISLDLDPARKRVRGSTGITAVVLHDSLASVSLDYCGPAVFSVTDGAEPRPFTRDGDQLIVSLSRVRRRGESFTVVVRDSGTTDRGLYWPRLVESPSTYTFSEPEDARFWFPCHDVPNDKATLSMLIRVPGDHVAASNGHLAADYYATDGRRVFHWVSDDPIAPYLIGVAVAPYAILRDDRLPGIPIVNYVYRPDSAQAVRVFDKVPEMIQHFSSLFGPYPFEKYGHAAALFPGGMEHQTMTLISEVVPRDTTGNTQTWIAHELAHQWFGDSVTPKDWRHAWLNEGFATYSEALWREHVFSPDSLHTRMALYAETYARVLTFATVPVVDPPSAQLFLHTIYYKGAWILHMLRHIVGDQTFFRILREYHSAYRHGNADTDDFIGVCERVAGRRLDWYFQPWLYGLGIAKLRFGWSAHTTREPRTWVTVTVEQAQDSVFYPMPVDFAFKTPGGERRETIFIDRNPQTFTILMEDPPVEHGVVMDPDHWILGTIEEADLAAVSAPSSRLLEVRSLSRPGAPPVEFEVRLSPGEPVPLRAEIHDVLGRRVATPYQGLAATGTLRIRWSGADDRGEAAKPGVYFARVTDDVTSRNLRLILIR